MLDQWPPLCISGKERTYVFDIWAWVNGDNITMTDSQVVTCHPVESGRIVIEFIICQHQENCLLSLFSLYQHGVATEELKGLHNIVGEGND